MFVERVFFSDLDSVENIDATLVGSSFICSSQSLFPSPSVISLRAYDQKTVLRVSNGIPDGVRSVLKAIC